MEPQQAIDLGSAAVMLAVVLAAPVLLVGMIVGLLVSVVQAVTQLQDQTLSFVPKLAAMAAAAIFFLPWLTQRTVDYAERLWTLAP
jgi:flagellar biosynthetic protein FliQ